VDATHTAPAPDPPRPIRARPSARGRGRHGSAAALACEPGAPWCPHPYKREVPARAPYPSSPRRAPSPLMWSPAIGAAKPSSPIVVVATSIRRCHPSPKRTSPTRGFLVSSRMCYAASRHRKAAGTPPPPGTTAGRPCPPPPIVSRLSPSKVSSPTCSPRSPPSFPQLTRGPRALGCR
jgi:hypothetical protein